ncbi:MAG: TetR/AcrR family transcriptional regulator [Acidobacteriota bacterium]
MAPATRRRLSPEERQRRLLELGLELFGEAAYDQISTDEIAERGGVSRGLLFHYFGNKRGFYVAVIREAADRLLERSKAAGQADVGTAEDPERAQLDVFLRFVEDNAGLFTVLMQGGVGVDAEVKSLVDQTRQVLARRVAPRLDAESLTGSGPDLGERFALTAWIGAVEAAAVEWADHRRRGLPTLERRELAGLLLGMVPTSIRSPTKV